MRKKSGILLIALGALLLAAALAFAGRNQLEAGRAGQEAQQRLTGVRREISAAERAGEQKDTGETPPEQTGPLPPELPIVNIDGTDYVGEVQIPALGLELPVQSDWSYDRLRLTPCRQFGSSRTDDLVIAAHAYRQHFGRLHQLQVGDEVLFTDMEGIGNRYEVAGVKTLDEREIDAVKNSGYALVLYTCTVSGDSRTAVFCSRAADAA